MKKTLVVSARRLNNQYNGKQGVFFVAHLLLEMFKTFPDCPVFSFDSWLVCKYLFSSVFLQILLESIGLLLMAFQSNKLASFLLYKCYRLRYVFQLCFVFYTGVSQN